MDIMDLKLAIYESMYMNQLDKNIAYEMLDICERDDDILTEGVFSKGPFNSKNLKKN